MESGRGPAPAIIERMDVGLAKLQEKHGARRRPKAFYLGPADWADFSATDPPTKRFPRGNNPTVWGSEPTYEGLPVRASKNVPDRQSKLYDHTSTGRVI